MGAELRRSQSQLAGLHCHSFARVWGMLLRTAPGPRSIAATAAPTCATSTPKEGMKPHNVFTEVHKQWPRL